LIVDCWRVRGVVARVGWRWRPVSYARTEGG
jgi:hypothetical protein